MGGQGEPSEGVEVVEAGLLTTVQDLGRPGHAHLGVPRSGVMAPAAAALANRLVGNPAAAALLEVTLTGVGLRFLRSCVVAVTGAECELSVAGRARALRQPQHVRAGEILRLGQARTGLRSYLAVAGGIDVPCVLGSRSTDTLSGLGPAPLAAGDVLRVGEPAGQVRWGEPAPETLGGTVLRLHPGPRLDWLTPQARDLLAGAEYRVDSGSNRIGLRLAGPRLAWAVSQELPSEGAVRGAVQVPPDGHPVVFGADHPTTGGYPVVAVVEAADLDVAAQLRPGEAVRLRWISRPR